MPVDNSALMRKTQDAMQGKWALAIGTFLLYSLFVSCAGAFKTSGSIIGLIIAGPFMLGAARFSLNIARRHEARVEQLFQGFNNFLQALGTYLLMLLFVCLWTLLLIIPGIVAALSYAMAFYILADEPSVSAGDALRRSKAMMQGHKWKLFGLCFRFFLLALLCVLTLGIGFLWLIPFVHVTMAGFYDDLKHSEQRQ